MRLRGVFKLCYTSIFWTLSILAIILSVGDRMALKWTEGDYIMRRDSRNRYPDTDQVGRGITEWFWVISARTLIVSLNISFITVMWVFPNFLEEAAPRWLDMDVRHANIIIHKFAGIWLNGVVTVIHVLLLFLPSLLDGTSKKLLYEGFDFSQWWDPCVRNFSQYISKDLVIYTWDEVFRVTLAILVFCIMMPISRANWMLYKSYSLAMGIHAIAGFLFMIDMVRKNSHPLCWKFNLPFMMLYVIDRFFATFCYRVNKFTVYKIRQCSESSFVLFGRLSNVPRTGQGCGDNYWLLHKFLTRTPCTPMWQRAHPYTAFQNWDPETEHVWNVGFVVNVNLSNKQSWSAWLMRKETQKCLESNNPKQKEERRSSSVLADQIASLYSKVRRTSKSYTVEDGVVNPAFVLESRHKSESTNASQQYEQHDVVFRETNPPIEEKHENEMDEIAPCVEFDIVSYGPYRSSFYQLQSFDCYEDLVLIAGGSGFGFILSAITMLSEKRCLRNPESTGPKFKNTTIIYSARHVELISMFAELVSQIPDFHNCHYHMRYTGSATKDMVPTDEFDHIATRRDFDPEKTSLERGRMELNNFFDQFSQLSTSTSALVCACGSRYLLKEVKSACDKFGLRLRVEEV